ncbi:hypothetical protein [Methylobacterium sp. ID0610]|uniref:hypothetical protein n=1 Tax=Methylobacterium carpenticola TaxID=3344827 RepID=UPI0036B23AB6
MDRFTVTVETLLGPLYLCRTTAEAAIETGRLVQQEGVGQVFITSPGGVPLPLADFTTLLRAGSARQPPREGRVRAQHDRDLVPGPVRGAAS